MYLLNKRLNFSCVFQYLRHISPSCFFFFFF